MSDMKQNAPFVVGSFFQMPVQRDDSTVYGFDVAVNGALRALQAHSSVDRIEVFVAPHVVNDMNASIRTARLPGKAALRFHGEHALFDGSDKYGINLWHQLDTQFRAPVHLRSAFASKPFPITFTVHCQSPQPFLHQYYLPLLLDDIQPYDSFICTSRASKDACERLLTHVAEDLAQVHGIELSYRGRIDIVPLGIDTDRFAPGDKPALRQRLGFAQEELIILWHGRFSAADKADLLPLMRVFQRLVANNPDRALRLVIAGCDIKAFPFQPAITNAARELGIADSVTVLEGFPANESQDLYGAADIFVSPIDNIQETFGLTPIEAMSCGVPQVVSDWNGYRDTVRHQETGFLVPTYWLECDEDLTRLAMLPTTPLLDVGFPSFLLSQSVVVDLEQHQAYLQALIENPDLRRRMSEASRRRAVECYSWPVIIKQLEALWKELASMAGQIGMPALDQRKRRYHQPRYYRAFQSYPTSAFDPDTIIRITQDGLHLLAGKGSLPNHYGVLDLLAFNPSLLRKTLSLLAASETTGRSLGSLATELLQGQPHIRSQVLRHVMRMLKHGLAVARVDGVRRFSVGQ